MRLKLWQVDAFGARVFEGNPAAVVPLSSWLPDRSLQAIAEENNLAETAFFVEQSQGRYELRWFTPTTEVPLCGHATLASAFVIFSELAPRLTGIAFETKSGTLTVTRGETGFNAMEFPSGVTKILSDPDLARDLAAAPFRPSPQDLLFAPTGGGGLPALLGVWKNETELRALDIDEQLALVALAWVGRGTYDLSEWAEALATARSEHSTRTAEYLLGLPLLGDYLGEGLAAFGEDCSSFDDRI